MKINVVMLGGIGCGKTSALVSMFEQVVHGPVGNELMIADNTQYANTEINLMSRRLMLENSLESCRCVFMADGGGSMSIDNYTFSIRIPGERKPFYIRFTNVPGSMLNSGSWTKNLQPLANESDVIIIAINTPYLMECDERIAMAVNRTQEIRELLSSSCFDCQNVKSSKMVIFMPVKCEKWIKTNKIDEVNDRIKSLYSSLIREMQCNRFISICIIPVQTIGGIEFMEMRKAYNVESNEGHFRKERCSLISENVIIFPNGKCRVLEAGERLYPESIDYFPNVIKPIDWYRVCDNNIQSPNKVLYNPHNCEQILLHIIRYYAANNSMSIRHLIKDNMEGIEYVTI